MLCFAVSYMVGTQCDVKASQREFAVPEVYAVAEGDLSMFLAPSRGRNKTENIFR